MNAIIQQNGAIDPNIISSLVMNGDIGKLSPQQKVAFYNYRCKQVGLDPSAQPFQVLKLNGKEVLYATAGAMQQLCALHKLSVAVTSREKIDEIYCVTARVTGPDGRSSENMGSTPLAGLKGEALSNALLKATTKAIRRTVLAHCGLGMLDETEVETIPGAQAVTVNFKDEARQIVAEMDACGERDHLDAFFASKEILEWLARADAAVAGKSTMSQGDYVRQMFHQIRDGLPDKKVNPKMLIKSTDEYGGNPAPEPPPPQATPVPPMEAAGETHEASGAEMDYLASIDSCSTTEEVRGIRSEIEAQKDELGGAYPKLKRACAKRYKEIELRETVTP